MLPLAVRPDQAHGANDEAIRNMLAGYAAAYNEGDPEAAARFSAADCEYPDEDGKVIKGRDAIRTEPDPARTPAVYVGVSTDRMISRKSCSVKVIAARRSPTQVLLTRRGIFAGERLTCHPVERAPQDSH